MNEIAEPQHEPQPETFSRLDIGMLIVLVSMAIAGVIGLIAVLDADNDYAALGVGFGIVWIVFFAGGTIACALACLARRRLQVLSLGALVAAGLAVDLLVLAIWLDIDDEWYGKLVGLAFVGALFGLVVLGLTLACRPRDTLAKYLYFGAVGASLLGALVAWLLILTTGGDDLAPSLFGNRVGLDLGNDFARPLAAILVVLATLWFAALAASRVERATET
ncbi:MAG TPA: hypothetical protein VJ807_08880 [Gaiellaceae bacterium]|nr:hypothetical protein [Gaiellaceae bacterium]